MSQVKYHAELQFKNRPIIRFTAVDLERLVARFSSEVLKEQARSRAAHEYIWLEPNLVVEVCHSWSEFDSYRMFA